MATEHRVAPTNPVGTNTAVTNPAATDSVAGEAVGSSDGGAGRLWYLDRIRVVLTVVVIVYHLAMTYGNLSAWYYSEPVMRGPKELPPWAGVLDGFVMVNAAYFMGFFFLISGFFVVGSYDRKGGRAFVRDRLRRLGIPLLLAYLVLIPLCKIPTFVMMNRAGSNPYGILLFLWPDPGPMWFIGTLLLFCLGYAWVRRWTRNRPIPSGSGRPLRWWAYVGFGVLLAAVTFGWRMFVPIPLVPILGIPLPVYIPQYILLFAVGVMAYRRNWFATLPRSAAWWGLGTAAVATAALFPIVYGVDAPAAGLGQVAFGVVQACWEAALCVGMCVGVTALFSYWLNRPGRWIGGLGKDAYTVYLVHAPLLILVGLALSWLYVDPLLKWALAAVIAVPLCFAIARQVRILPGLRRIL